MANTSPVFARIDAELKSSAEEVMSNLGISPSAMIQMLYKQIINQNTIPFVVIAGEKKEKEPSRNDNVWSFERNIMQKTVIKGQDETYKREQDEFSLFVAEVLDNEMSDRISVLLRFQMLPTPKYGEEFGVVIIEYGKGYGIEDLFSLENIFPNAQIVEYKGNVIIFDAIDESKEPIYDRAIFNDYLKKRDAFAGQGIHTRYLSALPTAWKQCQSAIKFGRSISEDVNQHIFNYPDYSMYLFLEMCTDNYFEDFHHGKYHMYCCQEYLDIERYDREHATTYTELLKTYLDNNCKIAETARELFVHRNTLIGKIEKIESIMGKNLNDKALRERLIFSYYLSKYLLKCKGRRLTVVSK